MSDLKAKKRDITVKGKKLRREGIIPAVLYGKHLDESVHLEVSQIDVIHFLNTNSVGSRLELVVGRKKYMALLKEISYVPVTNAIEHISFQALTAGEKVTSAAHIVLLHREKIEAIVQQDLSEISFKALPNDLIERIEIDLTGMEIGTTMTVADLPEFKNEALEILNSPDEVVFSIYAAKEFVEETPEDAEEAEEAAPEVPLVDDEQSKENSEE